MKVSVTLATLMALGGVGIGVASAQEQPPPSQFSCIGNPNLGAAGGNQAVRDRLAAAEQACRDAQESGDAGNAPANGCETTREGDTVTTICRQESRAES